METKEVNVMWVQKYDKKCLKLTIHGHLSEKNAFEAVSKWKEELSTNLESGEKANIICNCLNMTGYDTGARKLWQQTISDLKSQIEYIWIISDNKLFRTAAKTMGLLTKFKIKTANSESDICIE